MKWFGMDIQPHMRRYKICKDARSISNRFSHKEKQRSLEKEDRPFLSIAKNISHNHNITNAYTILMMT